MLPDQLDAMTSRWCRSPAASTMRAILRAREAGAVHILVDANGRSEASW